MDPCVADRVEGGEVDEHGAQERERDADRADDDVLPRGLERPSVLRWPTRNVVAIVVASTATHIAPRLAASTAASMQATKTWTSTV